MTLALIWGLRRSEIIGLQCRDIDWSCGVAKIRHTVTQQTLDGERTIRLKTTIKNCRVKVFAISEPIRDMLKNLIEENRKNEEMFCGNYDRTWDEHLFRHPDGKLVAPDMLTKTFRRFLKKHQFKEIRFHDLRHSCASILFANGTDLLTIQEILGHAQLTTTIMYTHKISDRKELALRQTADKIMSEDAKDEET